MHPSRDTTQKDYLNLSWPNDSTMLLEGIYQKDTLKVTLQHYDRNKFLLVNRGFNWINEYPYNR